MKRGDAVEIPLNPGEHSVLLKIAWMSSRRITFVADAGDMVALACAPGGSALSAVWSLHRRADYIAVERIS